MAVRNGARRAWGLVATVAVATLLAAPCGGEAGGQPADGGRLRIATTVAPLTSIVAAVAGDRADVTGIVPEGTNSHTFEPKPSVAELLSTADVVFANGLSLEEPTVELATENLKDGAEVVLLGDGVLTEDQWIFDFSFPKDDGKPNPHLWTHPLYADGYARLVRDTLMKRDRDHASEYEANYNRFAAAVDELDAAMRVAFRTVPAEHRTLLTYHDAYAYFARDYGWKVVGAIQLSDFEDPTPRDVVRLIDQVRAEKVPAIFGSEVFPSPVLEQIGRETGARYVDVLRDDDLPGKPGAPEHSWLGLMRFDFRTITEALGGDAAALDALDITPAVADRAEYPQ